MHALLAHLDAHLGNMVVANLNKLQGSVHCSMPDHHNICHRAGLLRPIMQA